ncbi:MAG: hypothetical protein CEE43_05835 [Promethearchaeota archaeon Loki_b32]|nr:MAG: hypothetical protein CEE43_05835 [Candidatus Lokiarchaeota archaeon Loki_b32]
MSEKEMQNIIKEYLKKVKSKLPEWLKDKKEHEEILAELEEHIWNKAEELSNMGQPTMESVKSAITHMGTPESIAKEYKRRGTPKYYITEELWQGYLKVLGIVFAVIFGITLISQVIDFVFGNVSIGELVGNIFQGIQIGFLSSFVIISIIFVALSMEGYFPEDFKSKGLLEKERKQLEIAREKGISISEIKKKPVKPFIKPVGEIIGGAIAIVIGIFFLAQPIPAITSLIDPEFLLYLQFAGLFILTEGILDISRGLIGNRQMITQQVIHGITIVVKLASISVVILIMNRPDIFPILVVDDPTDALINIGLAPEYYALFRGIAGLLIALVALSTIEDFYKIYKAEKYKN